MPTEDGVQIVLLCAASGTGLTRISDWFDRQNDDLVVGDIERSVCKIHEYQSGEDQSSEGPLRMETVARYPRQLLYKSWRQACTTILNEIVDEKPSQPALISLHLTWYNPNTSEFFSPINLDCFRRKECSVVHIIILIDDIYDMYFRLRGSDDLYGDDFMGHDRKLLAKLAPRLDQHGLQVQATELALGDLLSWRRAEMIQAENMAQSLGSKLTILGTKHHRQALEIILSEPNSPRTYLSHRITEHRRYNMATRTRQNPLGKWIPVVDEVNTLHREFVKKEQVLINPTAIDELRFRLANKWGRRDPLLGRRWPMLQPNDDLLCSIRPHESDSDQDDTTEAASEAVSDYEHTRILLDNEESLHTLSTSVASSLASKIFFEIALRDHAIVENTPNLCVYRPFYCRNPRKSETEARWSEGVLREIEHWRDSQKTLDDLQSDDLQEDHPQEVTPRATSDDVSMRRAAFVHTTTEIRGRLKWQLTDANRGVFLQNVENSLRGGWKKLNIPDTEISRLFSGEVPISHASQLNRRPRKTKVQRIPDEVVAAIRPAVRTGLHLSFTSLESPEDIDRENADGRPLIELDQVALFKIEESRSRDAIDLESLVRELCDFFGEGCDANDVSTQNDEFWNVCYECFKSVTGKDCEQYVAEHLNVPLTELQQLAGPPRPNDTS